MMKLGKFLNQLSKPWDDFHLRKWITSAPKHGISMMISDYFDRKWHLQTNHWCSGVNSLRFFFWGVIPQKSSKEILGEFSYWSQGVTGSVTEILGEFWERRHKNKSVDPPKKKTYTWNAKCPIFLGNFTPKTSNYCLKNRALGFPGMCSFLVGVAHFYRRKDFLQFVPPNHLYHGNLRGPPQCHHP